MNNISDKETAIKSITQQITVIMPCYNAGNFLKQAIDSILAQTFKDYALVIVDDASTDHSWDIIKSYDDPRIIALRNPTNIGHLRIRNRIFKNTPSPYITFLDADDWCIKERLQIQHEYLEKYAHIHMCGSFVTNVFSNTEKVRKYPESYESIKQKLTHGSTANYCSASVMFRSCLLSSIGYYDELFIDIGSADIDWQTRVTEKFETSNIPLSLYFYRQHEASFSKQKQHRFSSLSSDIAYLLYHLRQNRIDYDKQLIFSFLDGEYPNRCADTNSVDKSLGSKVALVFYRITPGVIRDYYVNLIRRTKVKRWLAQLESTNFQV